VRKRNNQQQQQQQQQDDATLKNNVSTNTNIENKNLYHHSRINESGSFFSFFFLNDNVVLSL
jgi:hypothetical protein